MKIVKVLGGLGNQMFQYAFYLNHADKSPNRKTLLDITSFAKYKLHNGYELEKVFENIDKKYASDKDFKDLFGIFYYLSKIIKPLYKKSNKYIKQKELKFDQNYLEISNGYFNGYWQSEKYFKDIEGLIRCHFKFPNLDIKNQKFIDSLSTKNTVSIHIRRGDYVNHPDYKDICTLNYYKKAILHFTSIDKNCHFVVFSNDINWCKNILIFSQDHSS